jgi:regulator of sirC expression with transglutaminase-like and TPR domain
MAEIDSLPPGDRPPFRPFARGPLPTFEELAQENDEQIDVALAAALIARDVYEELDVPALLGQLDELAQPLKPLGLGQMGAEAQALELAHYLYERQGFAGNEAAYYDPRNSLLPDVLERRLGIPITLALVYCEIARRVGVPARGVGFPGHFLVRIDRPGDPHEPLMVDAFFGGQVLRQKALNSLLARVMGPGQKLRPEHLAAASPRAIVARMLMNLKAVYMARGEDSRALLAADRLVSLTPNVPSALRDRGLLAARLGAVEVARADFQKFLELAPEGRDKRTVLTSLAALDGARHWLN